MRVLFGDCLLDSETRELTRAGQSVHVSPKAFQLLELLLAERPKALAKEVLHERLWPSTFVADTTLTGLVAELRSAIGDDARAPSFIRTLPVFGYSFCGTAMDAPSGAAAQKGCSYRLVWLLREISLGQGENVVGRGPESVAWIDDESVSRRHARIRIAGEEAFLEDLGSKNGTFLKGRRLDSISRLQDGDEIRVGHVSLTFRVFRGEGSTKTAVPPSPDSPLQGTK
jgi:DNA-binding winged helix-turn-helix (wHTH) protein